MGTTNALQQPQQYGQGMSRGFWAGGLGAPADMGNALLNLLIAGGGYAGHKTGLLTQPPDLLGPPVGGSEWIAERMRRVGLLADTPGSTADTAGNFTGGLLGLLAGVKLDVSKPVNALMRLAEAPANGKIATALSDVRASKTPSIFDPKPTAQRPFNADYPQGAAGPDGSRLAFDIDGRPLSPGVFVAGRRTVGGVDQGLTAEQIDGVARSLAIPRYGAPRTGPDLKGDAGRYIGGPERKIFVDQSLTPVQTDRVFSHEVAHAIDDLAMAQLGPGGSRIPTNGLSKELARVYEDLNTAGWFKLGRGMTPKGQGYAANQTDAELMAEAVRAYMRDPNYLKTVAPNTAARIREYVNANPNLNKTIQFNSLAPAAGAGLLGAGLFANDDANALR
jgi:hypothetical protein